MPSTPHPFAATAVALAVCAGLATGQGYPKISPFQMVRFAGQEPQVRIQGAWYELQKIQGITRAELLEACRKSFGDRWAKRFCEDLPQCLALVRAMPKDAFVTLELRDLKTGKTLTLDRVEMTSENRRAIWRAEPRPGKARLQRLALPAKAAAALEAPRALGTGPRLDAAQVREDLEQLHWLLDHTHSYARLRGFAYKGALARLAAEGREGMARDDFHLALRSLVARLGDGHARVRGLYGRLPRGYLPCRTRAHEQGVLALRADGAGLLDPEAPLLKAIDGRGIAEWLAAAGRIEARGSVASERHGATRNLAFVNWLRHELQLPLEPTVALTLAGADGRTRRVEMSLADRPIPEAPAALRFEVREGTAYLRIPAMEGSAGFVAFLHDAMRKARDARGLVIDVRGNGGGTRDALRTLLPYFMAGDAPPFVANIACFRLPPDTPRDAEDGYLQDRFLYPVTSKRWSRSDQAAIRETLRGFKPRWIPPGDQVSAPHFMLVHPARDAGQYHYDKPVALLVDGGCFSATDVFAGALKDHGVARLFGQPTGGGSGRSRPSVLANSRLEVLLSSMVSYRPSGQLYDGVGVQPHAVVWPELDDLRGGRDRVWIAAEAWIRAGGKPR